MNKIVCVLAVVMMANIALAKPIKKTMQNTQATYPKSDSQASSLVDKIIAIVNNEIILASELKNLNDNINKPGFIDETLLLGKSLATLSGNIAQQTQYLINEKIIESEIKKNNLTITPERLEQEFRDMAKKNNLSEKEFSQILIQQGFNVADYKKFLKNKLEKQALVEQEIISKIRISDQAIISEYYKIYPNRKSTVDEFSVAHIFFNPKKNGANEAENRASHVLTLLKQSGKFEQLAEQYSEDPNFENGGFLGTFKSGEFIKELEEEVIKMKPNDISNVVKSKAGYHILKLISKKVTPDPNFEKQKETLRAKLMENAFITQFKIWLQMKIDEAHLVKFD